MPSSLIAEVLFSEITSFAPVGDVGEKDADHTPVISKIIDKATDESASIN